MRRTVAAGIILACVAFIAGGVVQGQRQVGMEAAVTRPPDQVEVINLPAVQPVSGSVEVANLPLGADGSLRVTGVAPQPGAFRFFKLPGPIVVPAGDADTYYGSVYTEPVPVAGWEKVTILVKLVDAEPDPNTPNPLQTAFRFGGDGVFAFAPAGGLGLSPETDTGFASVEVPAPEMTVVLYSHLGARADVWVYLSN